jgi:hypothetical protein
MNKKFLPGAVLFIITFVLSNFAFLGQVKAVDFSDTFYGINAGNNTTTGLRDSAFGLLALSHITSGSDNTATGANALANNGTGGYNTASGAFALYLNTSGSFNTASGYYALYSNDGNFNTASGYYALVANTSGSFNTASGYAALVSNTTGTYNMANGDQALFSNTTGAFNAANGALALYSNTNGNFNTASGPGALYSNTTGSNNVAVGLTAGISLTTGSGNVCIGAGVNGVAGESNTTRIRNVYTTVANGRAVYVNSDNKIGTLSSSRRFKHDIQPMDRSSETLFALKPVTFRYKKDADPSQALSFGLIAEDVAQVSPELITRDEEGKPQTVRYEAVNSMLLNEFLKEHQKVERLTKDSESKFAAQQKQIEALTATVKEQAAQIQKVSAQVQLNGAPAIAANR